jgi:hypothetical protein
MTDEPMCGATTTYPRDREEMLLRSLSTRWAGVTVACDEPPHECAEGDVVHSGSVHVDGEAEGVSYWGPGWTPRC